MFYDVFSEVLEEMVEMAEMVEIIDAQKHINNTVLWRCSKVVNVDDCM